MVQAHAPKDFDNKEYKKKKGKAPGDQPKDSKDYLKIWDVNPSFKDINIKRSIIKVIMLIFITVFLIVSFYVLTNSIRTSIGLGIFFLVVFIIIFHDEFFYLQSFMLYLFGSRVGFNPFEHYAFWLNTDDPKTLFVYNKKDLIIMALRIYSIEVIPENVHPTIDQFVRSFSIKNIRISYSYQLVQRPIINLFDRNAPRQETIHPYGSAIGKIYFTVFCDTKGILSTHKLDHLEDSIKKYSNKLRANIVSNFHHFKSRILSDEELLNAVRLLYVRAGTEEYEIKSKDTLTESYGYIFFKLLILIFLLVYTSWFIYEVIIPNVLLIIIIDGIIVFFIIFFWWRSILFGITRRKLIKTNTLALVSPFKGVRYYTIRRFPYSLFMYIDNRLLIGMKIVNLKFLHSSPFHLFGRFIEALNSNKIYFTYTLKNEPLDYYYFYEHVLKKKNANEKTQKIIFSIKNKQQGEDWLAYRNGMWDSFLTLSVNKFEFVNSLEKSDFENMEDQLNNQIDTLTGAFQLNFHNYEVEHLKTRTLLSGYLYTVFKHNKFRIEGSYLNHVMLQGTTVGPLNYIVDILKKSVNTKIAAEFNTPLHLTNFIDIGFTINTEVLEEEVAFGFTYSQLQNLLIVNGTSDKRQYAMMKIVAELIQKNTPSLIFDFDGNWSKLLSFFETTRFKDDLLYFRLGTAFTINPLISEIPYDTHNTDYIEYMLDAFALAFNKDQRVVDMFRSTIYKNPDMDLPSMLLESQTQSDWQKTPSSYFLQSLFSDLTQQDMTLFQDLQGDSKNKITFYNFISNDKTVIVDLSILKDIPKKLFFAFMILSKIIHYTKYETKYHKKIIIVPNIDLFFNFRHLYTKMDYGKIKSFLSPLIEHGFGFIFSADQIRNLHTNIHNYFSNIITFKATDKLDIATLRNLMSLQEILGTGVYSSSRNQTYQLEYLKTLKDNHIIVRRDDIYQSFPALIEWDDIKYSKILTIEEINQFMGGQGYDLHSTEQKILNGAMQTIFEKDLGQYIFYIDEIMNFLKNIKSTDKVGNLYEQTVKDGLKVILHPKLSKKTNNKEYMKNVRDDIYEKLVKHGYLEENHPKRASGSETLRTSYKVGEIYEEACKDYFKIKGKNPDIQIEEVEENIFPSQPRKYIVQQENFWAALKREFGQLYYDMSKIYNLIEKGEYSDAIKIGQITLKKYLINVYRHYYNIDRAVMLSEMTPFFKLLADMDNFPFTAEELNDYINQYQQINLDVDDDKEVAEKMYEFLSKFFDNINNYLVQE